MDDFGSDYKAKLKPQIMESIAANVNKNNLFWFVYQISDKINNSSYFNIFSLTLVLNQLCPIFSYPTQSNKSGLFCL